MNKYIMFQYVKVPHQTKFTKSIVTLRYDTFCKLGLMRYFNVLKQL